MVLDTGGSAYASEKLSTPEFMTSGFHLASNSVAFFISSTQLLKKMHLSKGLLASEKVPIKNSAVKK